MKTLYLLILSLLIGAYLPVSAQKLSKAEKAEQLAQAFQKTQQLINDQNFKIEIDKVYPLSGHDVSRFNPKGKITITDSLAEGNLPYFGRAYSLPYGEGGGIEFNAPMKEHSTKIIEKKNKKYVNYRFSVPNKNDVFQFSIDIFPGGNCTVNLISNNRTQISYSGTVSPLEKE